jgi:hypothetical protein
MELEEGAGRGGSKDKP